MELDLEWYFRGAVRRVLAILLTEDPGVSSSSLELEAALAKSLYLCRRREDFAGIVGTGSLNFEKWECNMSIAAWTRGEVTIIESRVPASRLKYSAIVFVLVMS